MPTGLQDRKVRIRIIGLVVVALLGCTGWLERAASSGPLGSVQDGVVAYLSSSETKAVEAFAVARAINATVSVLKSTDLSAVVAQVAPLEVLEPVDDLAKQFSDVMVVSIVAILVQRLILLVSQAWALSVLLPIGCLLLILSLESRYWPGLRPRLATLGRSVILLALFARFVVLAAGWAGESVTHRFLAGDLDATMNAMQAVGGNLTQISAQVAPPANDATTQGAPPAAPPDSNAAASPWVFGQLRAALHSTAAATQAMIDKGRRLIGTVGGWVPDRAAIEAVVAALPGQMVKAIEIFLVQTILTPLAVAFILYGLARGAMRPVPLAVLASPPAIDPPPRAQPQTIF